MIRNIPFILVSMTIVASAAGGCSPSVTGAPDLSDYQGFTTAYFAGGYSKGRIEDYDAATSAPEKQALRNSIVLSAMGGIDVEYAAFVADLTREGQGVPFAATLASISLSGAGTLVGSAAAKTALAAVDTGVKGAKAAYDTNILSEKTIQFLQKQMRANRNIVRSTIVSRLGQGVDTYPLELAMIDVNDYAAAGTIAAGLMSIDEQASQSLTRSEDQKVTTIFAYAPDRSTAAIRTYLASGGTAANNALRAWLDANKLDRTQFLNDGAYAASRSRFMKQARIPDPQ